MLKLVGIMVQLCIVIQDHSIFIIPFFPSFLLSVSKYFHEFVTPKSVSIEFAQPQMYHLRANRHVLLDFDSDCLWYLIHKQNSTKFDEIPTNYLKHKIITHEVLCGIIK